MELVIVGVQSESDQYRVMFGDDTIEVGSGVPYEEGHIVVEVPEGTYRVVVERPGKRAVTQMVRVDRPRVYVSFPGEVTE